MNKKIILSRQALKRLPVYMAYLKGLVPSGTEYVSSATVAEALDMNDVQVRKDLAAVCKSTGIPKKGFMVRDLIDGISDFLGYSSGNDAILVGAGNLGMALMSYRGFDNYGINIVAAFDSRPEIVDNEKVFDVANLKRKCKEFIKYEYQKENLIKKKLMQIT